MEPVNNPDAELFLSTVLAWLVKNGDPRAVRTENGWRINDLARACADFCGYMAERAEKRAT